MTTPHVEFDDAALLDVCVDRLLAGEDWRIAVAGGQATPHIATRMDVAEIVLSAARQSGPRPDEQARTRIWRRMAQRLNAALHRLEIRRAQGIFGQRRPRQADQTALPLAHRNGRGGRGVRAKEVSPRIIVNA